MNNESLSENGQEIESDNNASSTMDVAETVQSERRRTNPFDAHLLESLHRPTFTPSIFARDSPVSRATTSRGRGKRIRRFRWSIDHIAALNPAQIDEDELALQEACQRYDDETEARLQAAINQFFSQPIIAPSPWKSADHESTPCDPVIVQSPSPWTVEDHADHQTPGTDLELSFSNAKARGDDDINSSVYLLSSSSDEDHGSSSSFSRKRPYSAAENDLKKPHRTSIGIDQFSSPEISPIKDLSPILDQEPCANEAEFA